MNVHSQLTHAVYAEIKSVLIQIACLYKKAFCPQIPVQAHHETNQTI